MLGLFHHFRRERSAPPRRSRLLHATLPASVVALSSLLLVGSSCGLLPSAPAPTLRNQVGPAVLNAPLRDSPARTFGSTPNVTRREYASLDSWDIGFDLPGTWVLLPFSGDCAPIPDHVVTRDDAVVVFQTTPHTICAGGALLASPPYVTEDYTRLIVTRLALDRTILGRATEIRMGNVSLYHVAETTGFDVGPLPNSGYYYVSRTHPAIMYNVLIYAQGYGEPSARSILGTLREQ